ncbi:MAG: bifunctional glutamate N-acetyltransferase/amino-acid acetyltransferase ArgJ, partial [Gammaproteobacteria bacterium]
AVFTRNAFCAAPVQIARAHLQAQAPRYLLINAGNANAGTGKQGYDDALACCQWLADLAGCRRGEVLPFSTGVIGEPLPTDKFARALPRVFPQLSEDHWAQAAEAIMTTDTVAKVVSLQAVINDQPVCITGIAKGSGMIRPDMATMLAYIATDAAVPSIVLQQCLQQSVDQSFNRISVDGDTSTNDACVLMATAEGELAIDSPEATGYAAFQQLVQQVCETLARAIVRDGEGATKLINIVVSEGASEQECLDVAYTIAHSPLVKTAFFASDPNWGRILAAVGRAGLQNLDLDAIRLYLDHVCIVEQGGRSPGYTEARGQAVMAQSEITIKVQLGRGTASATVWTCDFSYDYVRINAEYRT